MASMSERDLARQQAAYGRLERITGPCVVTRDGADVSPILESANGAFSWLIRNQSQSVGYALTWGGYDVRAVSGE